MGIFDTSGYRKTDKIGPLEIDRDNRVYRIHGARKVANKNNLVKNTVKLVLAPATLGLSLIGTKDKKRYRLVLI